MDGSKEKRKNLLAIDGGASGLPALLTMDEIFYRTQFDSKSDTEIMPCQHFDMISATGPGAIVAILIGKLRFTVSKAINAYTQIASAIPNEPAKDDDERRNNMKEFEEIFKRVMKEAEIDANSPFLDDEGPKILICTVNTINGSSLYPLRSYRTRSARPAGCSILQAACASIASPDRFLPVTIGIGHRKVVLMSAIVGYANPTKELLREAEEVFGAEAEVATVLSIGAGRTLVGLGTDIEKRAGIGEGLLQGMLNSKQVHEEIQMRLGQTRVYFRFNVDHELGVEPEIISADISDYLKDGGVSTRLDDAIKSIESRPEGLLFRDINSVRIVEIALKPRPPLVKNFIGRQDILDTMHRTHITNRLPELQSLAITLLFGLGGSGKTQTALKFALEYEKLYPNAMILFLNARSEESLQADLETLIRSRGPGYRTKTFNDALVYLSRDIKDWMVILDNADNPSVRLYPYIPTCTHGNVIITTRNSNYAILSPNSSYHLEGLSTGDAVKLILATSCYNETTTNGEIAKRIVLTLGHLPLALSQAGTCIYVHKCLSTYLELYRKSKGKLLSTLPWELPSNYPTSGATTIQMSFKKLSQSAQDVMRLFAHMDSASISHEIIEKAALTRFRAVIWTVDDKLESQTVTLADALCQVLCPNDEWSEVDFNEIITQCLQYSLLRLTTYGDSKFYSMHVLVQSYLQLSQEPIRGCEPRLLVIRILGSSILYNSEYKYLAFNRLLVPHVRIIQTENVLEAGDLFGFGHIFYDTGSQKLSIECRERCVEMWRSSLGEEDQHTLNAMGHLSISYKAMGQYEQALELNERVVETHKRVMGPEHPNTLIYMMNLATSYSIAGQGHDAVQLQEDLLEVQKRVLGPDHVNTLMSMSNLAAYYAKVGRYKDALEIRKEVVDLQIAHLGLDNPITLTDRSGLAACYWNLGMQTEALDLNILVMDSQTRILGSEHPDTLYTIRSHLTYLHELGMTAEAYRLVKTALPAHETALGIDHPDTIEFKELANEYIRSE